MNKVKEIEYPETAGKTWNSYPQGTVVKFVSTDGTSVVLNPYRIVIDHGLVNLHSGDAFIPPHVGGHMYEKVYGVTIVNA